MSLSDILVLFVFIFGLLTIIYLTIKRKSYDGEIVVRKDEATGKVIYSLEVNVDPYEIEHMKTVLFKVVPEKESTD